MARNTNQAPVVRRPDLDAVEVRVNQIFEALAQGHGELLQRQQILEAAYLSLARDVEYILGGEPEDGGGLTEEELADDPRLHGPSGENRNKQDDDDVADVLPATEESPEEEAARLIAEAEAANETQIEHNPGWPPQGA